MECQKQLFSLNETDRYINCAYMSPLLSSVQEAGMEGIKRKNNPQTISANDFFQPVAALKGALCTLIHASDPASIAIIPSASYGISTSARNIPYKRGQNIVIVAEEFPSNYYCWLRMAQEHELELRVVGFDSAENRDVSWNQNLLEAIDEQTAVVAVSPVHWFYGTVFDLAGIAEIIKGTETYFVVDGTQSVGIQKIDVVSLGIDALICAGYKWLMGPYSLGFAYYGPRFQHGQPLEENWIIRAGRENFATLTDYTPYYTAGAGRYDMGETSNFILVPMLLQAVRQINSWGVENMYAYVNSICQSTVTKLRQLGLVNASEEGFTAHLFSVAVPPDKIDSLKDQLVQEQFYMSFRSNYLRISPNVYNTAEEMQQLAELLEKHLC